MEDRICPNINCCEKFKYPSGLKRHFETSHFCKKDIYSINTYFSNIKAKK